MKVDWFLIYVMTMCMIASFLGSLTDYSVTEGANTVIPAFNFSQEQWSQLVGGGPLILKAGINIIVAGELIDNFDRPRMMVMCLLGCGISTLCHTISRSYGSWVAMRYLWNACTACIIPLVSSIATSRTPDMWLGVALSLVYGAQTAADTAALGLVSIFGSHWQGSYFVDGSLMLLMIIPWALIPEVTDNRTDMLKVLKRLLYTYQSFFKALRTCPSVLAWSCSMAPLGAGIVVVNFFQLWLVQDLGMDNDHAVRSSTWLPIVGQYFGALLFGALADWLHKRYGWSRWFVAIGTCIGNSVTLIILVYVPTGRPEGDAFFWFFFYLAQFFLCATPGLSFGEASELVPKQLTGCATAFALGIVYLFNGLAGWGSSCVAETFEGWNTSIEGHPAPYSDTILLVASVNLLQLPFYGAAIWFEEEDRPKLEAIGIETEALLPHGGRHDRVAKHAGRPAKVDASTKLLP